MKHHISEIPDTFATKNILPFEKHVWNFFEDLGFEYLSDNFDKAASFFTYDMFKLRMNEAILTAKEITEGKIKEPEKVIAFTLFPPGGMMRSDMQRSSMTLYYGDSASVAYIGARDDRREVYLIIFAQLEQGIPVDWFLVPPGDELLDRRHLKLGYKLKEIPKKIKDFKKAARYATDILKDVRNERTPQWSDSPFNSGLAWGSFAVDFLYEPSGYEMIAGTHDMYNKRAFLYHPKVPLVDTVMYLKRKNYTLKTCGLMSEHKLFINCMEKEGREWVKKEFPEIWEKVDGIWDNTPYPIQTLDCELPNPKKNDLYFKYPEGKFISLQDLGMNLEEALNGVFLDITHETEPGSVDLKEKIISTGVGRKAKIR